MVNPEEEEELQRQRKQQRQQTQKTVIKIPSYQEVIESSQSKSTLPSLFSPSPTFSHAFSFIKSSEFYSPPPPPPPPPPPAITSPTDASTSGLPAQVNAASTDSPASSSSSYGGPSRNAILVSHRQVFANSTHPEATPPKRKGCIPEKGNPLLKHIRNVRWAFADIVCDYLLGQGTCALYLSLRYHLLHPDYLYYRIRELQKNFKLRVVLCHVDVEDVVKPLLEVTKTSLLHDCTLLCAWSLEECGRYLETIKVYENKPADIIQGQMDTDYLSRLSHALTTVRHVNKTDVVTLGSTFGSLSHVMDASMEDLARCPGIGERKVKRLYDTFHEPFKRVVRIAPIAPEVLLPKATDAVDPAPEPRELVNASEDTRKKRKKEPEVTVKSALSAAFAKYANKLGKRNSKTIQEKAGETSGTNTKPEASAVLN